MLLKITFLLVVSTVSLNVLNFFPCILWVESSYFSKLPHLILAFHELQNLREAIGTYRNSILRQPDEMKREASLSFFVEYLERYYFLICFAVYLHSERDILHSSTAGKSSFSDWMRARPELYSIIRRLKLYSLREVYVL